MSQIVITIPDEFHAQAILALCHRGGFTGTDPDEQRIFARGQVLEIIADAIRDRNRSVIRNTAQISIEAAVATADAAVAVAIQSVEVTVE